MALEIHGTSPTTGEVLIVNTATDEWYWAPGTTEQIDRVTDTIIKAGDWGTISYERYEAPAPVAPKPEATIFDSILDWIGAALDKIKDAIINALTPIINAVKNALTTFISFLIAPIQLGVAWLREKVEGVYYWATETYGRVADWVKNAYTIVYSAVSSALSTVWYWLQDTYRNIASHVTSAISEVWTNVANILSSLRSSLSAWVQQLWSSISTTLESWSRGIVDFFKGIPATISSFFTDLFIRMESYFTWLTTWMTDNVVKPMASWWDSFINRILDFPAWVDKLFDAISDWVSAEIPGHSPRWTGIFENIGKWFVTWFYEFPKFLFTDFGESVAYGLSTSFKWVADFFEMTLTYWMDSMMSFAKSIGPFSPSMAPTVYSTITKVGMVALGGLTCMTIAGELLHPLKRLGLGNLAAMIFDATNYKLITGAFMGALSASLLRTPLTYYFNDMFRPMLPSTGDLIRLAGEYQLAPRDSVRAAIEGKLSFTELDIQNRQGFRDLMKYYGYQDEMIDRLYEQADRPLSYFALAAIAKIGVYNDLVFRDELRNAGYSPNAITLLLDMFRKQATESVKAVMVGAATKRYKEGLTTQEQLISELTVLRANPLELPLYVQAAKMDYATDYALDLVSSYQDAVRKGNMDLNEFRQALLNIPIVPERVESYVLKERARLKPTEKLSPLAPAKPYYDTEAGKIEVDTIRRSRRKLRIGGGEEIAQLVQLGMPPSYAEAIADNDEVRLAEKETAE